MSASDVSNILEQYFNQVNEIADIWATSCAECSYENFDEFIESNDLEAFHDTEFTQVLIEMEKFVTTMLLDNIKADAMEIFTEARVNPAKFNLLVWYLIEMARKSSSTGNTVRNGVNIACVYLGLCTFNGVHAAKLFQEPLFEKCLKIMLNCARTIQIGDVGGGVSKKANKKKQKNRTTDEGMEEEEGEVVMGPPRIGVDRAEDYLQTLTTMLYAFFANVGYSIPNEYIMMSLETIEEIGRLELDGRTSSKADGAMSMREFRAMSKFVDRYAALLHIVADSKFASWSAAVYGRIVRPRLALLPFASDANKTSKISTERKRAAEIAASFVIARLARNPPTHEMKLIRKIVEMIYYQCPDLQEYRALIAGNIVRILKAFPYEYAYDFVQSMRIYSKSRTAGVKQLSIELASQLLDNFDFSMADPGAVANTLESDDEESDDVDDEDEAESERDDDDDEEETRRNRSRRGETRKRMKKVPKKTNDLPRIEATKILYRIIYMSCLDKTAASRHHGAQFFAKILEDADRRAAFADACKTMNDEHDEKYGEIDDMNETIDGDETRANPKKGKTDLMLEEQAIIQKFKKLNMMNRGATRIETDVVFMLLKRLATDEKAPVRKSTCAAIFSFLLNCGDREKFEAIISLLELMCRDRLTSVRKVAADAMNELMMANSITFKEVLSSKWLGALLRMLNDGESEMQDHARKLIMKVLSPLLECPNELTWTLLKEIETVTTRRHYLMATLKETASSGLVKANVMETMKKHIEEGAVDRASAWMVLSQLSVVFKKNVEYAVEALYSTDLSSESKTVKYIIHVIANQFEKIPSETRADLLRFLQESLRMFTIHSSHARDIYHCVGRMMDGIGDEATNAAGFVRFGKELVDACFDTIVESFEMFKNKNEWSMKAESQERYLIVALNVTTEVFLFAPSLVPMYERLGKTLLMIVNAFDKSRNQSAINPDIPSLSQHTRPVTQMSEVAQHRVVNAMLEQCDAVGGVLFGDKTRAICAVALGTMILLDEKMLKLMPMFAKQLQINPAHEVRSNIVLAIGDICETYKTDRYAPVLAAALCDPSVVVRKHAILEIARLVSSSIFRFGGEVMIRIMLAILDANEDVRNDARLYIREVLQNDIPGFFSKFFVHYMIYLTQAKRIVRSVNEEENGHVDVTMGGGESLARSSRIAIYNFMIESLDDRQRFEVKKDICLKIINPIINGEFDFGDDNVYSLLEDALLIMSSSEMQVKMEVGKSDNENGLDEPPEAVMDAATKYMREVYLQNYMNTIIPSVLSLREFLIVHKSLLMRKCQLAIRMICIEHKNDLDVILRDNRQLKDEMAFELQRVKQRAEEANRILDEHIKKVVEFNKKQRRQSKQTEPMDVGEEGAATAGSPMRADAVVEMATPQRVAVLATPSTARVLGTPRSERPLSPKTVKKIRRSIGLLMHQNELALKPLQLDETHATLEGPVSSTPAPQVAAREIEESAETAAAAAAADDATDEAPAQVVDGDDDVAPTSEAPNNTSRRRKTPTPEEHDESRDANGKVWKRPKFSKFVRLDEDEEDRRKNFISDWRFVGDLQCSTALIVEMPMRILEHIDGASPDDASNVTLRRSVRSRSRAASAETANEAKKAKTDEQRGQTPIVWDETLIQGRHCSTPIRDENRHDVTFDLNLSAIDKVEREEAKRARRKTLRTTMAEIAEDDE
ncbi:unnamed protein product [Caenorhabditis bovis]|uniref:Condensin complex subunit 1 C-terminal domain-containing protein n=1 Tax=Caenorhabditis bovis TaxID=2654633 RepID=A0A8S1F5P7_9PELO|nr:unnamed protein product [Caenorhabditis bovis]